MLLLGVIYGTSPEVLEVVQHVLLLIAVVIIKLLGAEGRVAVQVHGGTGWPNGAKCRWRNVYVRKLN